MSAENQLNHQTARLVIPHEKYINSFLEAQNEFLAEPKRILSDHADFFPEKETVDQFINRITGYAQGLNLPQEDWVPETILWLIDNETFIGKVSIRHRLTEYLRQFGGNIGYEIRPTKRKMGYGSLILKLGLIEAKKLGISDVLITCNATNMGSKRIIEKNGGEFLGEQFSESEKELKRRYSIKT